MLPWQQLNFIWNSKFLEENVKCNLSVSHFLFPGQLGQAPEAVDESLPTPAGATAAISDEEEEDVEDMQARLEALRS